MRAIDRDRLLNSLENLQGGHHLWGADWETATIGTELKVHIVMEFARHPGVSALGRGRANIRDNPAPRLADLHGRAIRERLDPRERRD